MAATLKPTAFSASARQPASVGWELRAALASRPRRVPATARPSRRSYVPHAIQQAEIGAGLFVNLKV